MQYILCLIENLAFFLHLAVHNWTYFINPYFANVENMVSY